MPPASSNAAASSTTIYQKCPPLASFQLYGWEPQPTLSIDDNFLDLLVLVTRNSECRGAHMGCIISRPFGCLSLMTNTTTSQNNGSHQDNASQQQHTTDSHSRKTLLPAEEDGKRTLEQQQDNNEKTETTATTTPNTIGDPPSYSQLLLSELEGEEDSFFQSIVSVANNMPLYKPNSSDVHAEVTALGQCAKMGISTQGCTAYITMPPCKTCLGALVMAGIHRIVTLRPSPQYLITIGHKHQIQVSGITDKTSERKDRIENYVTQYHDKHGIDPRTEITRLREQRKVEKQERQKKRKLILVTKKKNIHPSQLGRPTSETNSSPSDSS